MPRTVLNLQCASKRRSEHEHRGRRAASKFKLKAKHTKMRTKSPSARSSTEDFAGISEAKLFIMQAGNARGLLIGGFSRSLSRAPLTCTQSTLGDSNKFSCSSGNFAASQRWRRAMSQRSFRDGFVDPATVFTNLTMTKICTKTS
jgi:hypothetical protein